MIMNTLETGYKTPFCSREKLSYILFVLICDPYTLVLYDLLELVLGKNCCLIGGLFLYPVFSVL